MRKSSDLGLLSLDKRRLWGDVRAPIQDLLETYRKAGEGLLTGPRDDGCKIKQG